MATLLASVIVLGAGAIGAYMAWAPEPRAQACIGGGYLNDRVAQTPDAAFGAWHDDMAAGESPAIPGRNEFSRHGNRWTADRPDGSWIEVEVIERPSGHWFVVDVSTCEEVQDPDGDLSG